MELYKPTHVVLLSSAGLGHLIPVIKLGKRFALHHNFKVTVLAVTSQTSRAEVQILNSTLTPSISHVIEVPSPDLTGLLHQNDRMVTRLCVMMREAKPAIRSLISKITPRPSALIVDMFGIEAIPIARELNILNYVYVASHAWMLALVVYSPVLDEKIEGQYMDQKESLKIPGCSPVRPKDMMDQMLDRSNREYKEYLGVAKGIPQSDSVLVNTWKELQRKDLEALREGGLLSQELNMKIPVYGVGPLVRQPEIETSSLTESVVTWLDEQPSESVVYVSFGSGGTMSYEQMTELAWGLELSEQRFIWVVRAPTEGAADATFFTTGSGGGDEMAKYLPEGALKVLTQMLWGYVIAVRQYVFEATGDNTIFSIKWWAHGNKVNEFSVNSEKRSPIRTQNKPEPPLTFSSNPPQTFSFSTTPRRWSTTSIEPPLL
ncbi:Anthocyanidin 3-O-glucosyltransferase 5 [Spatholobus suberectus]|nr:Anthocyanidin 3-O-glucosyltransferase 5 [Spatholobus suberectus]